MFVEQQRDDIPLTEDTENSDNPSEFFVKKCNWIKALKS